MEEVEQGEPQVKLQMAGASVYICCESLMMKVLLQVTITAQNSAAVTTLKHNQMGES